VSPPLKSSRRAAKTTGAEEPSGELAILAGVRAQARAVRGRSGLRLGIGDDCALAAVKANEEIAITTDLSIAGRHFELTWHPPESIGHRVLARGLSDLAAMGARPVAAFLSLGLQRELVTEVRAAGRSSPSGKRAKHSWFDRFYDGFLALAAEFGIPLAGGDLAESSLAVADIHALGAVKSGKALLRSGARPGDRIYVTGALGGAAMGLAVIKQLAAEQRPSGVAGLRIPKRLAARLARHLFPQPRVAQGLWLVRHGVATAAIDISDGLSTDLRHLCDESRVAVEVHEKQLPISPGATLDEALNGGEDYELLFTAAEKARIPPNIAGVQVTRIGRVVKRSAKQPLVTLVTPQGPRTIEAKGWEHFA
jgi:thiamine-monophosphate kinase